MDLTVVNGSSEVATLSIETLSSLVLEGNLNRLNPAQTVEYYRVFCQRLGLDPATQPFKIITLQGKKVLYCDRSGTSQLNKLHSVSHEITKREKADDLYIVTAKAKTATRETECIGAVAIAGLKGEALCNAMMKAETKAKRRSTLDLLGLGMLDESELGTTGAGGLGGEETLRPIASVPAPLSDEEKDEQRLLEIKMRKARASLNAHLQPCKDEQSFKEARGAFRKEWDFGRDIWEKKTYHNAFETFMDLVNEHWSRIDRDLRLDAEIAEKVKEWVVALDSVTTFEDLDKVEKTLQEYPALRDNATYCDMVSAKGREIGHPQHLSEEI